MRAFLLLCGFLLAVYQGQTVLGQPRNWNSDLSSFLNNLNQDIQSNVHLMTQQIEQNVKAQVEKVNQQVAEIQQNVKAEVEKANQEAAEALENAAKQNGTQIINDNGSVIISNNNGTSHSIHTGTNANGRPYYVISENFIAGDILYHTDRVYNYTTKEFENHRYTLNLSDPNAKPIYLD